MHKKFGFDFLAISFEYLPQTLKFKLYHNLRIRIPPHSKSRAPHSKPKKKCWFSIYINNKRVAGMRVFGLDKQHAGGLCVCRSLCAIHCAALSYKLSGLKFWFRWLNLCALWNEKKRLGSICVSLWLEWPLFASYTSLAKNCTAIR